MEIRCNSDPNSIGVIPLDIDGDGVCNRFDEDDDGDGFPDNIDRFPEDRTEWRDDDRDGVGRNSEFFEVSPGLESALMTVLILIIILVIEVISIQRGYNIGMNGEVPLLEEE